MLVTLRSQWVKQTCLLCVHRFGDFRCVFVCLTGLFKILQERELCLIPSCGSCWDVQSCITPPVPLQVKYKERKHEKQNCCCLGEGGDFENLDLNHILCWDGFPCIINAEPHIELILYTLHFPGNKLEGIKKTATKINQNVIPFRA